VSGFSPAGGGVAEAGLVVDESENALGVAQLGEQLSHGVHDYVEKYRKELETWVDSCRCDVEMAGIITHNLILI